MTRGAAGGAENLDTVKRTTILIKNGVRTREDCDRGSLNEVQRASTSKKCNGGVERAQNGPEMRP